MGASNARPGCPSSRASPRPRRTTSASSFWPVVCQPTDARGFSRTKPLRIPAVCGIPRSSGQSPSAHVRGNVCGCGGRVCDERGSRARKKRTRGPARRVCMVGFIVESPCGWVARTPDFGVRGSFSGQDADPKIGGPRYPADHSRMRSRNPPKLKAGPRTNSISARSRVRTASTAAGSLSSPSFGTTIKPFSSPCSKS